MSIRAILNRPIKQTLITIGIAGIILFIAAVVNAYYLRLASTPVDTGFCSTCRRGLSEINEIVLNRVAIDFWTMSQYVVELGILFLVAQIIYRLVKRGKSSK